MADVIGLASSGITIISFLAGLFSESDSASVNVRIHAGLNGRISDSEELIDADGEFTGVKIYEENDNFIASGQGANVESGGFADSTIYPGSTVQPTYAQIASGKDGLCISAVTMTDSRGDKRGWVGDWGYECGVAWSWGRIYVDAKDDYQPRCTWIDEDNTDDIGSAGSIKIHFPSFVGDDSIDEQEDPESFCGSAFQAFWNTDGTDPMKKKRREHKPDHRLIISNSTHHSAKELCESNTSRGPSALSLSEGLFCDMESRKLLPLCDVDDSGECFRYPENENGAVKRDGDVGASAFKGVLDWTS